MLKTVSMSFEVQSKDKINEGYEMNHNTPWSAVALLSTRLMM